MNEAVDCLVVGGGPAGLTAAVYLARYRRALCLVDAGDSRVQWIPRSRNVLGFPDGISGTELLQRLREHAARYGVRPWSTRVQRLMRHANGLFEAELEGQAQRVTARAVILCTGAHDIPPDIEGLSEGLRCGQVRYCPICDGYETQHQRVAVLGRGGHGLREAMFVAGFDNEVSWLSMGSQHQVEPSALARLQARGVRLIAAKPLRMVCHAGRGISVDMDGGQTLQFEVLYPALGQRHECELAIQLGARLSGDGQLVVDAHLQTTVPGLYAAGDVAQGLNQINVAAGHAAIAATAVHNAL